MKVLLLNGSPHVKGCTARALDEVARTLNENGVDTEQVHVGLGVVRGCIGCYKCQELGRCVFNDDIVNPLATKFAEADGVVLGSPVYYASAAGTFVSLLDRLFFSASCDKRMKVGAAVVSCRRAGNTATFDILNKYFSISEMPIATAMYWNEVHGATPEEVEQDLEGLQTMRVLARNMAFLMRAIAAEKALHGLPAEEPRVYTNFMH
ncbi:MAG: flavodoxin family protein [Bacteroidales bacterium]|nr:flavodoxin family protein [Bacteroidales bacterium]